MRSAAELCLTHTLTHTRAQDGEKRACDPEGFINRRADVTSLSRAGD